VHAGGLVVLGGLRGRAALLDLEIAGRVFSTLVFVRLGLALKILKFSCVAAFDTLFTVFSY
jgi:hypothetical protein